MELPADLSARYEVRGKLGRGGMSVVLRARQRELNRDVALKLLAPHRQNADDRRRFLDEGRLAASIRHPNVCPIYECGECADGRLYIAYELVEGSNLDALVHEDRRGVAEVVALVADVLRGLAAIHEAGIVHRDIKPLNVMLGADGRPRIVDFGIARPVVRTEPLTASGVLIGTAGYIAPEIIAGRRADAATDIYATGALLFALLAGRPPFQAGDAFALIALHAASPAPDVRAFVPGVPDALAELVDAALAKDPSERPASATAFAEELDRIAADLQQPPRRRTTRRTKRTRRTHTVRDLIARTPQWARWSAAVLTLALAVGAMIAWAVRRTPEDGPSRSTLASAPDSPARATSASGSPVDGESGRDGGGSESGVSSGAASLALAAARERTRALCSAALEAGRVDATLGHALRGLWEPGGVVGAPFALLGHALAGAGARDGDAELARGEIALALGEHFDACDLLLAAARDAGSPAAHDRAESGLAAAQQAVAGAAFAAGDTDALRERAAQARAAVRRVGETRGGSAAIVTSAAERHRRAVDALAVLSALRVVPNRAPAWGSVDRVGDLSFDIMALVEACDAAERAVLASWLAAQRVGSAARGDYWLLCARVAPGAAEVDAALLRGSAALLLEPRARTEPGAAARTLRALLELGRERLGDASGDASYVQTWRQLRLVQHAGAVSVAIGEPVPGLDGVGRSARRIRLLRSRLAAGHDPLVALAGAVVARRAAEQAAPDDRFVLEVLACDLALLARSDGKGLSANERARLAAACKAAKAPRTELFEQMLAAQPETLVAFDAL